jgi:hypothetical protein
MNLSCIEVARAADLQPGRKQGKEVLFACPRHADQHPSLTINPDKNVWLCGPCGKSGTAWELAAFIAGLTPDDRKGVASWLRNKGLMESNGNGAGKIVATYDYRDEKGNLLFQVVRYEPKGFKQRRPDGKGGWIWNLEGVRRVPYRLNEWKDKPTVYIAEGEKDADMLWRIGIPATTNPMGAKNWLPEYNRYFEGKQTPILRDNDADGEYFQKDVARNLINTAKAVKAVSLPKLPPKGDVSDWIAAGGTREELARIVHETSVITQAKIDSWQPRAVVKPAPMPRLNPWPVLAPEALYGLPGDIVRAIDPYTEADSASVLIHVLVPFGSLIGSSPHAAVQNDLHPARIFAVVIGESSKGRKGTSWSAPREVFRKVDSKWSEERTRSGLSSGEGLIYHVRDELRKTAPVKKGGRIIDYEQEIVDAGESDKRLLCIESEFSNMLKIMAREGNSLSGVVRQAWDSGNLSTLTRNNPLRATGAHVSIIGHTTRDELLRSLSAIEQCNGFGNRFLWLLAKRSKILPQGATVPEETMARLAEQVAKAVSFASYTGRVIRDEPANELWDRIYEPLSEGRPGLAGAVLNRAEAQVLRLSLIYALLDCSKLIKVEHLQAAIAVWDYVEGSVRYVFGDKTGNPVADRIMDALRDSEDGLTEDDIGLLFGSRKTEEKNLALEELLRLRRVTRESKQTGGRPETVWRAA